jgi:predicted AAA+ superfamily ATPase
VGFSYWRGKQDCEVDIIADIDGHLVPFEVKYRGETHTGKESIRGMVEFCQKHAIPRGYVITREVVDLSVQKVEHGSGSTHLLKIPAPLACYWLGRSELESTGEQDT